jgi:uncharacterized membrane protein YjjP (DUF1212 family)
MEKYMNSITTGNATTQSTLLNQSAEKDNQSMLERMAKSKGVPDEVIAKGKNAIKIWMKENGKEPSSSKNNKDNKTNNNTSAQSLSKQLDSSGISYESFKKALNEGPEATKELFKQNNFNINVIA